LAQSTKRQGSSLKISRWATVVPVRSRSAAPLQVKSASQPAFLFARARIGGERFSVSGRRANEKPGQQPRKNGNQRSASFPQYFFCCICFRMHSLPDRFSFLSNHKSAGRCECSRIRVGGSLILLIDLGGIQYASYTLPDVCCPNKSLTIHPQYPIICPLI
jgi:hypothetical protein